jgi:hypothetical protein
MSLDHRERGDGIRYVRPDELESHLKGLNYHSADVPAKYTPDNSWKDQSQEFKDARKNDAKYSESQAKRVRASSQADAWKKTEDAEKASQSAWMTGSKADHKAAASAHMAAGAAHAFVGNKEQASHHNGTAPTHRMNYI